MTRLVAVFFPWFVGTTADFLIEIDGHDVFAGVGNGRADFPDLETLGIEVVVMGGATVVPFVFSALVRGVSTFCHDRILLADSLSLRVSRTMDEPHMYTFARFETMKVWSKRVMY